MLYKILRPILSVIFKILYRYEVVGNREFPKDIPIVLCANHKSNMDPLLLAASFKNQIHFMAKKELFSNKILGYFIDKLGAFPVDRDKADVQSIKKAISILKDNKILGIFPEGTRVQTIDYNSAKSGVAVIAHRSKAVVIPVYIEGNYIPFKKMKVYIKDIMDLRELPKKLEPEKYTEISVNIMKSIYSGVKLYEGNTCK